MPAATAPKQLDLFGEKLLDPSSRLKHKLIGQLFDTYWLIEYNDHLYIIDQHAAHEKVLYEKTVKSLKRPRLQFSDGGTAYHFNFKSK